ncbi:MAG: indole-3-glycerol-phosphate synthase [Methanoregulaceae archaeon]|nr:indole-3-glycerol-phosphate synthase [Methanoregulaceae archaeon]
MILDQVIRTTISRVEGLPSIPGNVPERKGHRSLKAALGRKQGRNAIIAEIKFNSPSRGHLRMPTNPAMLAGNLALGGCSALSVLTEPDFFHGRPEFIPAIRPAIQVPVLRKDFIIDERQIAESAALGADAVLLIARLLGNHLPDMVDSTLAYGLEPLVEVHSRQEATDALATSTSMIGINNRDLDTLSIDLSTTLRLAQLIKDAGLRVVAESGLLWPCDVRRLRSSADGFLIGSAIMAANDPVKRLEGFLFA